MGNPRQVRRVDMKEGRNYELMESYSMNDSVPSSSSSSSSLSAGLADDASSSSSTSLYEFADLMKGLPKFYDGKSESFRSLMRVRSVEDLATMEILYIKRMKWSKSYGSNLNRHKHSPKATITKKSPT